MPTDHTKYTDKMTKTDQTITWLHLSDFHFKAESDWQQNVVLSSLLRKVIEKFPEQELTPDMVFLTGDIAHAGKAEEYQQAQQFFNLLREKLGHKSFEHWFIVPGNHDVDRGVVDDLDKKDRDIITEENFAAMASKTKFWRRFSERQQEFLKFTGTFLGADRAWIMPPPGKPKRFPSTDWTLLFYV